MVHSIQTEAVNLFRSLAKKFPSPLEVQGMVRSIPYEMGDSMRSAWRVWEEKKAHCLEASFLAAAVMEHLGYPPLVLSLESQDDIDHVVYVFKSYRGWGAIGRSREMGLHGRKPEFRSIRDLMWSYVDPYVDDSGRITGYSLINLDEISKAWRYSSRALWSIERAIIDWPHQKVTTSELRYQRALKKFESGIEVQDPLWW